METYGLGHRLIKEALADYLVDKVEKEILGVEELVIDWPAWARVAQALFDPDQSVVPDFSCIPAGIRLIPKIEVNYGDEAGLAIRLEEPDGRSYRMASREWQIPELHGFVKPVEWWVEELKALFADALSAHRLLLPDPDRELRRVIRRRVVLRGRDGNGRGYESTEEVREYVPDDKFSRAYLRYTGGHRD